MSLKVPVELPLSLANRIHNGNAKDRSQLGDYLVDAVRALPYQPGRDKNSIQRPMTCLPTPDSSIDGDDLERMDSAREIIDQQPATAKVREIKYQARVHWKDHGVYVLDVRNTMHIVELKALVEAKTGIACAQQRLSFNGKVLESRKSLHQSGFDDRMLRPSALWTQIELTRLSGICLPDSNLDFWAQVSGSVAETVLPVHARGSTSLRDLGMALFQAQGNLPQGRRLLHFESQVVYDSHENKTSFGANPNAKATLADLNVRQGSLISFRMEIVPT